MLTTVNYYLTINASHSPLLQKKHFFYYQTLDFTTVLLFYYIIIIYIIIIIYYDDEMMTSSVSLIVDIEDNLCERHFEKFILTMNATVGNKMIAGAATPFVKEASIALLFFSIWCFETFTENVLKTSPLLGAICAGVIVGPVLQGRALPERFCIFG